MHDPTPPRPGSPAAVQRGCTLPVLDNAHGAGMGSDGERYGWWQDSTCPLHGAVLRAYRTAEGAKP